ncbi:hypothetical protein [Fulvivirga kasyanovii]|uniref:Uncharacterized protein n=1 Tax=Fulvivirga kasyanovii TaxID=396812 RepID=A0ABW9RP00_9BACT|nr:hypothetical protein [Fulvivirga kasyanovii]MTI25869.1 hypothetical protein [Fulvivirga kasyanovii]
MKKQILILLLMVLSLSCTDERNTQQQAENLEETPEVLNENMTDISLSYGKRRGKDIIQQLFDEALSKDEKLRSINSRIAEIDEIKADSLKSFNKYIRNNQNYWGSLKQYADQLNDTTLQAEVKNFIEALESKYDKKTSPLDSVAKLLDAREKSLRDQEILMKIVVTAPMMKTYQQNEFPDINTMTSVQKSMDTLINDLKPYTQIKE